MSEQEAVQTEEDKFFGVRTKIGGQQQEEPVEEAEVVEASDSEEGELTDDELPNYSKRVQKRINKLKYELIKIKEIRTSKKGDMFLRKKVLEKYL